MAIYGKAKKKDEKRKEQASEGPSTLDQKISKSEDAEKDTEDKDNPHKMHIRKVISVLKAKRPQ